MNTSLLEKKKYAEITPLKATVKNCVYQIWS